MTVTPKLRAAQIRPGDRVFVLRTDRPRAVVPATRKAGAVPTAGKHRRPRTGWPARHALGLSPS